MMHKSSELLYSFGASAFSLGFYLYYFPLYNSKNNRSLQKIN